MYPPHLSVAPVRACKRILKTVMMEVVEEKGVWMLKAEVTKR
jgi:hypothetical protein